VILLARLCSTILSDHIWPLLILHRIGTFAILDVRLAIFQHANGFSLEQKVITPLLLSFPSLPSSNSLDPSSHSHNEKMSRTHTGISSDRSGVIGHIDLSQRYVVSLSSDVHVADDFDQTDKYGPGGQRLRVLVRSVVVSSCILYTSS
jgi:hypothetical protein